MAKNFDPIRARSSIEALQALAGTHPEAFVNVTALQEEVAAAQEEIAQLVRGLREAVEPPTFMGEPVRPDAHICWLRLVEVWGGFPRYEVCTHEAEGAFKVFVAADAAEVDETTERAAFEAAYPNRALMRAMDPAVAAWEAWLKRAEETQPHEVVGAIRLLTRALEHLKDDPLRARTCIQDARFLLLKVEPDAEHKSAPIQKRDKPTPASGVAGSATDQGEKA